METAANKLALEVGAQLLAKDHPGGFEDALQWIRDHILAKLPSQASVRTQEQID